MILNEGGASANSLKEDAGRVFWKRLGPTVRECKAMGLEKDGMCLYIKAKDELAQEAQKLLAETAAKELKGEEGEKLLKAFRDEAEAAEAGMGAMFG